MFLDKTAVHSLIEQGALDWRGEMRRDSLLLKLGRRLQPMARQPPALVDLTDQRQIDAMYGEPLIDWRTFRLGRGQLALFLADHPVALPSDVGGFIGGLRHMARLGLMVHLDTPIVDACFHGFLAIEMFNAGPADVLVRPGMPVAKVLLYRVGDKTRTEEPYRHPFYGNDEQLGSRYASEFFPVPFKEGGK